MHYSLLQIGIDHLVDTSKDAFSLRYLNERLELKSINIIFEICLQQGFQMKGHFLKPWCINRWFQTCSNRTLLLILIENFRDLQQNQTTFYEIKFLVKRFAYFWNNRFPHQALTINFKI